MSYDSVAYSTKGHSNHQNIPPRDIWPPTDTAAICDRIRDSIRYRTADLQSMLQSPVPECNEHGWHKICDLTLGTAARSRGHGMAVWSSQLLGQGFTELHEQRGWGNGVPHVPPQNRVDYGMISII